MLFPKLNNLARAILGFGVLTGGLALQTAINGAEPVTSPPTVKAAPPKPLRLAAIQSEINEALEQGISLEQRRDLLYFYSRLGRIEIAQALANLILDELPHDKECLTAMASMYTDASMGPQAIQYARLLSQHHPDVQSKFLLGAAYFANEDYEEAYQVFSELQQDQSDRVEFSYQNDLASSAYLTGRWSEAKDLYEDLLDQNRLTDEERLAVENTLTEIYWEHNPLLYGGNESIFIDSGEILRTQLGYRQHITSNHRVFLQWDREDTHVKSQTGIRSQWNDINEGRFGLESRLGSNWNSSVAAGGADSEFLADLSLTHTIDRERNISLGLHANERALDGLFVETLEGRQHRANLGINYRIADHWYASGAVYGRDVEIEDDSYGDGYGGRASVERYFERGNHRFRIGYRMSWEDFSQDTSDTSLVDPIVKPGTPLPFKQQVLKDLIRSWSHRQGGYLGWEGRLSPNSTLSVTGGSEYAFELSSTVFYCIANASMRIADRVDARIEGGYISDANSSDQDSDAWLARLDLRFRF